MRRSYHEQWGKRVGIATAQWSWDIDEEGTYVAIILAVLWKEWRRSIGSAVVVGVGRRSFGILLTIRWGIVRIVRSVVAPGTHDDCLELLRCLLLLLFVEEWFLISQYFLELLPILEFLRRVPLASSSGLCELRSWEAWNSPFETVRSVAVLVDDYHFLIRDCALVIELLANESSPEFRRWEDQLSDESLGDVVWAGEWTLEVNVPSFQGWLGASFSPLDDESSTIDAADFGIALPVGHTEVIGEEVGHVFTVLFKAGCSPEAALVGVVEITSINAVIVALRVWRMKARRADDSWV
jgi:hypothetical protein